MERFSNGRTLVEDALGDWVRYEDHLAKVKELEQEREQLRSDLIKYGTHIEGCRYPDECTCGYLDAIGKGA